MKSARVVFDFTKFVGAMMALPEVRPVFPERVELGRRLLRAMLDETCQASFLVSLPEEAFYVASEMLSEESDDPDIRAAFQEIDEDSSFYGLFHRVVRLAPRPDPSLAGEFI